jgi:uncharacterized repeat protein (TIGR04138 family)
MPPAQHPIAELLRKDPRYTLDAYVFVFEALKYAHDVLGMGAEHPGDQSPEGEAPERHLTGQELCEAIRQYGLEQYGFMAQQVLNTWGVHSTGDFGEIVFNLISIGQMRKTPEDNREDFDDVFDFTQGFRDSFRIGGSKE